MTKRFATCDDDGNITGFYADDVNPKIPYGAVEITEAEWRECLKNSGKYLLDREHGQLVHTPGPTPDEIEEGKKQDSIRKAERRLAEIDLGSIALMRAFMVQMPDVPADLLALEEEAIAQRDITKDKKIKIEEID